MDSYKKGRRPRGNAQRQRPRGSVPRQRPRGIEASSSRTSRSNIWRATILRYTVIVAVVVVFVDNTRCPEDTQKPQGEARTSPRNSFMTQSKRNQFLAQQAPKICKKRTGKRGKGTQPGPGCTREPKGSPRSGPERETTTKRRPQNEHKITKSVKKRSQRANQTRVERKPGKQQGPGHLRTL